MTAGAKERAGFREPAQLSVLTSKKSRRSIPTTSEAHASQLGDEQGEADADRCQKGGTVLLSCQEEDGEDELSREEHLNEKAACDGSVVRKVGRNGEFLDPRSARCSSDERCIALTFGNSAATTPALASPPKICAMKTMRARV